MGLCLNLSLGLALMAQAPSGADDSPEPTPFVPFRQPAYQLINSVDFSPDGQTMYFALLYRAVLRHRGAPIGDAPETSLFSSTRTEEGWSEPELLPFSGTYGDYEPTLSPDGTLMVFNSKRPDEDGQTPASNNLWMVERTAEGWGEPSRIEAICTFENEESYGALTNDRTLVYLRGLPDSEGEPRFDLYQSQFVDGEFAAPTRHPVSTDRWGEGDAWISPDGSCLIFTRWDVDAGWATTVDLYISFLQGEDWSDPVPMESQNTPGPDYSPAVSADGAWFYYRRNSRFTRVAMEAVVSEYEVGD